MIMKVSFLLLILGILLDCSPLEAQIVGPSTIDAAGTSVSAGGNTYEYAIGQVLSGTSYIGSTLSVTPGVIQPQYSASGVNTPIEANELQVFPDPVATDLFIQAHFNSGGILKMALINELGQKIISNQWTLSSGQEREVIDTKGLAIGTYFLQIEWNGHSGLSSGGYKIQKLQ